MITSIFVVVISSRCHFMKKEFFMHIFVFYFFWINLWLQLHTSALFDCRFSHSPVKITSVVHNCTQMLDIKSKKHSMMYLRDGTYAIIWIEIVCFFSLGWNYKPLNSLTRSAFIFCWKCAIYILLTQKRRRDEYVENEFSLRNLSYAFKISIKLKDLHW